ncbi:MAG: hypothetical protein HKP41_13860 [Desulfobacterales bacterium]|nr:hypothetical protein [Deltaproteobacteria bacterium]NNK95431.1 hypothetical protein [Desulfobacterales bacterium]
MDCGKYQNWLENKDLSDMSESNRAKNHEKTCEHCKDLAAKDQALDHAIARELAREPLPENLERIVALNLHKTTYSERRISTSMIRVVSIFVGICSLLFLFTLLPRDFSGRGEFSSSLAADHHKLNKPHGLKEIDDVSAWLVAIADFQASLPADFKGKEQQFIGGRICVIDECRTVHLVFREGGVLTSLYIMDARQVPASFKQGKVYLVNTDGNSVKIWQENHQVYALIT